MSAKPPPALSRTMQFRDQTGRALPPRANKAARVYTEYAFGGPKPTEKHASLLRQHASSISGGSRRTTPRPVKKLRRDAE